MNADVSRSGREILAPASGNPRLSPLVFREYGRQMNASKVESYNHVNLKLGCGWIGAANRGMFDSAAEGGIAGIMGDGWVLLHG
jgi:hypothetical protein